MFSNNSLHPTLSSDANPFRIAASLQDAKAVETSPRSPNPLVAREALPNLPKAAPSPRQSKAVPGLSALPLPGQGRRRLLLSPI